MNLVARISSVFLSFVALADLTSPDAHAQEPRGPGALSVSFEATAVQDSVAQYLMNPDGSVDGLLLSNNTIIRFPPHLGQVLPGQLVRRMLFEWKVSWKIPESSTPRLSSICKAGARPWP